MPLLRMHPHERHRCALGCMATYGRGRAVHSSSRRKHGSRYPGSFRFVDLFSLRRVPNRSNNQTQWEEVLCNWSHAANKSESSSLSLVWIVIFRQRSWLRGNPPLILRLPSSVSKDLTRSQLIADPRSQRLSGQGNLHAAVTDRSGKIYIACVRDR